MRIEGKSPEMWRKSYPQFYGGKATDARELDVPSATSDRASLDGCPNGNIVVTAARETSTSITSSQGHDTTPEMRLLAMKSASTTRSGKFAPLLVELISFTGVISVTVKLCAITVSIYVRLPAAFMVTSWACT